MAGRRHGRPATDPTRAPVRLSVITRCGTGHGRRKTDLVMTGITGS